MQEEAVSERRLLTAGPLRTMQRDHLEPLSAVSRMVALISHDLRHPLTAILANAEFLTRSDISELQRNDFYQEIRWGIDRINELVSSLLECSKGRDALRPAAGNIVDTVERAIRMTSVREEFRWRFPERRYDTGGAPHSYLKAQSWAMSLRNNHSSCSKYPVRACQVVKALLSVA
jgi:signal transduction histidine kinase